MRVYRVDFAIGWVGHSKAVRLRALLFRSVGYVQRDLYRSGVDHRCAASFSTLSSLDLDLDTRFSRNPVFPPSIESKLTISQHVAVPGVLIAFILPHRGYDGLGIKAVPSGNPCALFNMVQRRPEPRN